MMRLAQTFMERFKELGGLVLTSRVTPDEGQGRALVQKQGEELDQGESDNDQGRTREELEDGPSGVIPIRHPVQRYDGPRGSGLSLELCKGERESEMGTSGKQSISRSIETVRSEKNDEHYETAMPIEPQTMWMPRPYRIERSSDCSLRPTRDLSKKLYTEKSVYEIQRKAIDKPSKC
ncbi:hypothetical protein E2C01_061684 [Portunus trituberculatus]|uniref:Uncharacterized protein n=1 Tax=Portunus trituberculatus TaxID=210409 RepID=A0A5B7HDX6_PORTR|nr:hypothetical protein [Portunus trituberculatus]